MFGSDWPVCTLEASYADVLRLAGSVLDGRLDAAERAAVMGGNAAATYRLSPEP
jgi:L-fuconolactonase